MKSILKIKNIRKYLTQSAAEFLVLSTVVSHLDYCNSILAGLPNSEDIMDAKGTEYCSQISVRKK